MHLLPTTGAIPAGIKTKQANNSAPKRSQFHSCNAETNLAEVVALLRDKERLDERGGREREVPLHVPVGRADTVEQRRLLGQSTSRQEHGGRGERGGPRPGTQVNTKLLRHGLEESSKISQGSPRNWGWEGRPDWWRWKAWRRIFTALGSWTRSEEERNAEVSVRSRGAGTG
jgi:hypothetical protein